MLLSLSLTTHHMIVFKTSTEDDTKIWLSLSLNMGRHSRHVGEQWIHGGALHLHCIYKPFKFEHESVEHSFSVLFYYVAYDYICLCFQFLTPCYDYELLDNWFTAKSTIQTKTLIALWNQLSYRSCMKMKAPKQIPPCKLAHLFCFFLGRKIYPTMLHHQYIFFQFMKNNSHL